MTRKQISLVVIGLSLGIVLAGAFRFGVVFAHSEGSDAEARGDYATARQFWRFSAELGYTPSKATLGALYLTNNGGPADPLLADRYLAGAAEDGLPAAQAIYGMALFAGATIPRDRQRGLHWLKKAAEQGDLEAQTFLIQVDGR